VGRLITESDSALFTYTAYVHRSPCVDFVDTCSPLFDRATQMGDRSSCSTVGHARQ